MTSLLTFALSTASSFLTGAQEPSPGADLPAVGDSAPALEFDLVLGAGGVPTELDQEGKVVVVEFSTSWCAGCRAAVPHWNELAEELEGEDIVLVTVTNEDEAAAARFLADLSLKTPLAIDLDGSCFESFGVGGVPDAIVIDPEGRIAGFTHPRALTAKDLRRVAAGGP